MSSSHPDNEDSKGYSAHMRGVALGILVMGVSIAAVILLWATIGYKGPDFSTQVMVRQQEQLHEQYGLPPLPDISPEMLEVPPSLRNIATGANATNATTGANATNATTGANATNATTGATGNNTGTSATSAGGGTSVSI